MQISRIKVLVSITALLVASLACSLSSSDEDDGQPSALESTEQGGRRPAVLETAEQAARVAGSAAKTAAAQAGDVAGTAMVIATTEGSQAIGTVKALAAPHLDSLKEKLASIEPDEDGNYQVTFTEDEVNTVLRLRQLLMGDILGAGIESQKVTFRDGSITLSGTVIEPLPGQLMVSMRPSIEEGRLQLVPEAASVAGQEAPDEALQAAQDVLDSTLGEALEYAPGGVELLAITAENGVLTISGRKITDTE